MMKVHLITTFTLNDSKNILNSSEIIKKYNTFLNSKNLLDETEDFQDKFNLGYDLIPINN